MIEVVAVVVTIVGLMWWMGTSPHRSTRRFVFDIALYLIATVVNIFASTHHEFFLLPTLLMVLFLVANGGVCILHILFPDDYSPSSAWSRAAKFRR